MNLFLSLLSFVILTGFSHSASARIFNTAKETFAVYLRGSLDREAYENSLVSESKGESVSLDAQGENKISGEFGIIFANPSFNIRFGVDYIRPMALEEKEGKRAIDDVGLYTMDSELSILAPKATLELNLKQWPTSRFFISAGYGYATLSGRTKFSLTEAGKTHFNLTDFDEQLTGVSSLIEGGLGYENLLADTTTFVVEAGYRSLVFNSIDYNKETINFQGAQAKGQETKNMDGKARSLDLSGIIFGLSFRFWL